MQLPLIENLTMDSQEPPPDPEQERVPEHEEIEVQRREIEDLVRKQKARIEVQAAEIVRLRSSKEKYARGCRDARERIAKLDHEFGEVCRDHEEALKKRDRRMRAIEDELAQTKELLAARSTELSGAQSFLSTTDRLSEAEVLGIVRDLNENIFQVAANITEEWEKLGPTRPRGFFITKEDIKALSDYHGAALVHHVLDRDPAAVTFLIQSCLCRIAADIASSWRRGYYEQLRPLEYVYKSLCASEGQAISARWRTLTHSHIHEPPSHSTLILNRVAEVLWITGSFSSTGRSTDFVKKVAFSGMETVNRLALRLDSAFMVEITSSDMYLLYEAPRTTFDHARMTEECEPDGASTPRGQDMVAGTTEVGIQKCVCGRQGEDMRTQVLLKAKVVLEQDLQVNV